MARVQLIDVTKRYGATVAVDRVNADIAEGEFITLLGPSGCGKTTTLRMVAGLIDVTEGQILFDGQVVNNIPTHRRNIGLAFQSHALFPHMSVAKNIAFGLEVRGGINKAKRDERVAEMLQMMELQGFGDRMPAQLSGGQQQRVALARMLATDPRVLLFDEPLSALDRNLRDTLKYSILALQRRTKKTAIYVTHDQSEAFAISDRIFVMNQGRIEQAGTQLDIYLRPASEFVASFVGDNNALRGTVTAVRHGADGTPVAQVSAGGVQLEAAATPDLGPGSQVVAFIRPENIDVVDEAASDGPGMITGSVEQVVFEGPTVRMVVDAGGQQIKVTVGGMDRLTLIDGAKRAIRLRVRDISIVPAAG